MTDVVYVLGSGSNWMNNEIRFSLRSIEKNVSNVGTIWVVGDDPGFLKGVRFIPYPDELGKSNADGNIIRKVLRVCQEPDLSEDFLFINDDHLITQPMDISEVPALHKGDMTQYSDKYWKLNFWRSRLQRTRDELIRQGLPALHFDCHTPILFNKARFPEIISRFDYEVGIGFTMKSLYGNVMYPEAVELTDEKRTVFKKYSRSELNERLAACSFVSFNDDGLDAPLKLWLSDHFPNPSRWEIGDVFDATIEIYQYLQGPVQDYQTGCALFNRYCSGTNLKKLFEKGENPSLKKKLLYKLNRQIIIE